MKNEQEIKNQLEILKSLDKELDNYDKKVNELIETKDLEKSLLNCPPKKRAEIFWTAAFGIYTNKYLDLILDEKDPELHPIKKEMERLNLFRKKVVNSDKIEEDDNLEDKEKLKRNKNKKKENIYKQIRKLNKGGY